MRAHAQELGDGPVGCRVLGIGAAGFSIHTELPPEQQATWRQLGEGLLRLLDEQVTGLLITVGEIHGADRGELA